MIQLEFFILKKQRKFRTRMSIIFITSYSSHQIHHIKFITSNSQTFLTLMFDHKTFDISFS